MANTNLEHVAFSLAGMWKRSAKIAVFSLLAGYAAQDASAQKPPGDPTSDNFSVVVTPGEYVGVMKSLFFPFKPGSFGLPLKAVEIVDLPDTSQGRLVLETRYKPPKPPRLSAVTAGQVIPVTRTRAQGKPFLYFHASEDFRQAGFKFKVVDANNKNSGEYFAGLILPPPTSADFTVQAYPNDATALTQSSVFPFRAGYGRSLKAVVIESLPDASQGKLIVEVRFWDPSKSPPRWTSTRDVQAGAVIPKETVGLRKEGRPFLYFEPKGPSGSFSSANFTFKVVADDGVESATYTATLTATSGGISNTPPVENAIPPEENAIDSPPLNRAPELVSELEEQTVRVDSTTMVDMSGSFLDGGDLTYQATSSDETVVVVESTGSELTVRGVAAGTAQVTVAATDPSGAAAADTFAVEVLGNRAPVPRPLDDQTLVQGYGIALYLDRVFTDADSDPLVLGSSTTDGNVVRLSRVGARMTMVGVEVGTAQVTVWATDPDGAWGTGVFTVTVVADDAPVVPVNHAPVVFRRLGYQAVALDSTVAVDLSDAFTDADGDTLTYRAEISDATKASLAQAGTQLTLQGVATGTTQVMMSATDPSGEAVADTFAVRVFQPNRAPVVVSALADQTVAGSTITIDLVGVFADPDGDALTLQATSSDSTTASVAVFFKLIVNPLNNTAAFSPILRLTGAAAGTAAIEVMAHDLRGGSVASAFAVAVEAGD